MQTNRWWQTRAILSAVTIELKTSYMSGQRVAKKPPVYVFDDFVTEAECSHIINLVRKRLKVAKVTHATSVEVSEGRTGSNAWIKHDATPVIRGLVARVSELTGIPTAHAESLQVVHYEESQEYRPHYDAWDLSTEKGMLRTKNGGQRLVTALMYLNEVEAGGGTGFPKLKLELDPMPGRMVLFHNVEPGTTQLHDKSKHGGLPVEAGEKWACNLWFRAERYVRSGQRGAAQSGRGAGSKKQRKAQRSARRRNR